MSWDAYLVMDVIECPLEQAEIAWLAGLLEGEGCFRLRRAAGRARGNLDVQLNMTDEDVVRRAHAVSRLGTCHGPYQQSGNRKPYWVWKVSGNDDAEALMEALLPWMGARRAEQIKSITKEWREQPESKTGRSRQTCSWAAEAVLADFNFTHNTNGMIAAAYEAVTGETTEQCDGPLGKAIGAAWWDRLDGLSTDAGDAYLGQIIAGLVTDPVRFRAMNPENGWGSYDSLLKVLIDMRETAANYNATVKWRVHG